MIVVAIAAANAAIEVWREPRPAIESIKPDGALHLNLGLDSWKGENYNIDFNLSHEFEVTPDGGGESKWIVPQLQTYVRRVNRTTWRWIKPGGREVKFLFSGKQTQSRSENYEMNISGANSISISKKHCVTYYYKDGALVRMQYFSGEIWEIESIDSNITAINQITPVGRSSLLSVRSKGSLMKSIQFSDRAIYDFSYIGLRNAELASVSEKNRNANARFLYKSGLVTGISGDLWAEQAFAWKVFDEFRRSDHRFRLPYALFSHDQWSYDYEVRDIWVIIQAVSTTGVKRSIKYNLLTNQYVENTKQSRL